MTQVLIDRATLEQLVTALEAVLDDSKYANELTVTGGVYEGLQCKEALTAGRAALAQQELPQKERPDFMAGYDAGMADAKRMAQQEGPVAGLNRSYTEQLIHALHENSDPVSIDAAEEFQRLLAAALAQQPVCHGCGIPAGDVHMSTCKSGKWPSRVSNGDTAAPAPQPASEMVANFIVSAVVIKDTSTGFNTQNKLYPVSAANSDEATGKALPLVTNDFPEHRLHTMCFIQTAPAPQVQECNRSRPHELMDGYCGLRAEIARLMNEKARRG